MLPAVVPPSRLERANGWLTGGDTLMENLVAGPLGVAGTYRPHREAGETSSRPAPVWADVAEGFRWLIRQRLLRTMAVLIGLLNLTLTGALAVPVLLAMERLHLGSGATACSSRAQRLGGCSGRSSATG